MTLTPSNHNGFAITCFGAKDGQLTANVSGGTPPYTYSWSHGDSTQQVVGLAAGFYRVTVHDADTLSGTAEITLMEPLELRVNLVPFVYPNSYNISCADCYNGAIQSSTSGGLPPYQYQWNDDVTTAHRQDLGHHVNYAVEVSDANGCIVHSQALRLTQPDRSDWTMEGNQDTDPEVHFFGTTDSADLVLKSNGQERLRLLADGSLKLNGLSEGILMMGGGGSLFSGFAAKPWCFYTSEGPVDYTPWYLCGNEVETGPNGHFLGTVNEEPLIIKTHLQERMRITTDGKVVIAGHSPVDQFELHTAMERSGISLINSRTDANAHTEIRFKKGSDERWALGCDFAGVGGQDFFIWDAVASSKRFVLNAQGKVGIGTEPPTEPSLYKLYVGDGIATRDVKVTAQNWPDYVFAPEYRPMPLRDLRAHLARHQHLPGMFSEADVAAQGGVEIGDMQVRLLKLLEEQTLYILHLEERIQVLEKATTSKH